MLEATVHVRMIKSLYFPVLAVDTPQTKKEKDV